MLVESVTSMESHKGDVITNYLDTVMALHLLVPLPLLLLLCVIYTVEAVVTIALSHFLGVTVQLVIGTVPPALTQAVLFCTALFRFGCPWLFMA